MKALILYKDWLLKTRGEIRPEVGDKVRTTDNLTEPFNVIDIRKPEHFELQILVSVVWEYISDLYVEIELPEIEWKTAKNKGIVKGNTKPYIINGYINDISFFKINCKYEPILTINERTIFKGTLEECKLKAEELLWTK